jgi:hypothetical protein
MDAIEEKLSGLSDKAHNHQYAGMFKKLRKMIKNQEDICLGGEAKNGDYYVLNMLYNQMRELINDIRTIVDASGQANELVENILHPLSLETTQLFTDMYYQLKALLKDVVKEKQTEYAIGKLDVLMKEIARGLQTHSNDARSKIYRIMVGENPKARKRK